MNRLFFLQLFQKQYSAAVAAILFFFLAFPFNTNAQSHNRVIDSSVRVIDGADIPAGDTIVLKAGNRDKLLIRNIKGTPEHPVVITNEDNIVTLATTSYYGISIINCRYLKCTGKGDDNFFYGIQIKQVAAGSGIGIDGFSSDIEIDHIAVENCRNSGIMAKTDPDCSFRAVRDSFTQFNTSIHDNFISHTGNEGMYIGSSFYGGYRINCNGRDTTVLPPVLNRVEVYNNIVEYTGWDGIQVSSAPAHCRIYNNKITHDSQAEEPNQMSGIIMGGGSKCDCYNNFISDGKGDGIEEHGLGGNKIYNNIIVNAGRSFMPDDISKMKHGIFVSDVSALADSSFTILFNDIINPKSDGIRFQSIKSKRNIIASNLIIDPGNYAFYQSGNTSFNGNDAYVMVPNRATDIKLLNNYFSRDIQAASVSSSSFAPLPGSPLINKGYQYALWLKYDFKNEKRPAGGLYDIGAVEYPQGDTRLSDTTGATRPVLFPNPVLSKLTFHYNAVSAERTSIHIYNQEGKLVLQQYKGIALPGMQELQVDVNALSFGMYVYAFYNGTQITSGKFYKL